MDCPKCGYSLNAFDKDCPRCRRIAAEDFAKSPIAVWPPTIAGQPAPATPPTVVFAAPMAPALDDSQDNTSGSEYGMPLEVADRQWNWGAFFFGWLWCLFHGLIGTALLILGLNGVLVYFSIVILPSGWYVPSALTALVLFGTNCYLGLNGYRLAWEHRRFAGGESQFFRVQRSWAITGIAMASVSVLVFIVSAIGFMKAFQAYEVRRQHVVPPAAAPVALSGPAPMVLRQNQPEPVQRRPVIGGQGFRHPWDNPAPYPPRYRPGFGPGDIRTAPMPEAAPAPIAPPAPAYPVNAPLPDAPPAQNNPIPAPANPAPADATAPAAAPAAP